MYTINEVPALKLANGSLVRREEVTDVTAYDIGDGSLYEDKDQARQVLVLAAQHIIADSHLDLVTFAVQNVNNEEAQKLRYAVLFLAEVIKETSPEPQA